MDGGAENSMNIATSIAFNSADPHPGPGGLEGPYNELTRVSLVTGSLSTFFYRPGTTIQPFGIDQKGRLFVGVLKDWSGPEEVWGITSPTDAIRITTFGSAVSPSNLAAVDHYGLWFKGGFVPATVWLYEGGTFRSVATVTADSFEVAGGCIP